MGNGDLQWHYPPSRWKHTSQTLPHFLFQLSHTSVFRAVYSHPLFLLSARVTDEIFSSQTKVAAFPTIFSSPVSQWSSKKNQKNNNSCKHSYSGPPTQTHTDTHWNYMEFTYRHWKEAITQSLSVWTSEKHYTEIHLLNTCLLTVESQTKTHPVFQDFHKFCTVKEHDCFFFKEKSLLRVTMTSITSTYCFINSFQCFTQYKQFF